MILEIYLGTTLISAGIIGLNAASFVNKVKREGYTVKKKRTSIIEKITSTINNVILLSIPVFNVVNSLFISYKVNCDYEGLRDILLENGTLTKKIDTEINNCDEKSAKQDVKSEYKDQIDSKTIDSNNFCNGDRSQFVYNSQKYFVNEQVGYKTFSEMTKDEKIEYMQRERARRIKEMQENFDEDVKTYKK